MKFKERMEQAVSRRDFLKLAGSVSGGAAVQPLLHHLQAQNGTQPNVLVVVFDAWSAKNMSLYGYPRRTTPNLDRLAERAIVYHNHYAAGNFTTPGTASLLTGLYPWTHRALQLLRPVTPSMADRSIFHALPGHHRIAYTHNPVADRLLWQFQEAIDEYLPIHQLVLTTGWPVRRLFRADDDIASLSLLRTFKRELNGGYGYSLFGSRLYRQRLTQSLANEQKNFPLGLPIFTADDFFLLEDAVDFLGARLAVAPRPFLAYIHRLPPHAPYRTRREFHNRFRDDRFHPVAKPADLFGGRRNTQTALSRMREDYDEFVLYVDAEFGRLHRMLETAGVLDDTLVMLTSDHGEMFERGISQHDTPVLYQPVIHAPLIVIEPGRTERLDVTMPTSAVDVLPTLRQLAGLAPSGWAEGRVLPPFGPEDAKRGVYAVHSKHNPGDEPLLEASLMLVRGEHKLTRLFGYGELRGEERVELFNLGEDPEELVDLHAEDQGTAHEMLRELETSLAAADELYA